MQPRLPPISTSAAANPPQSQPLASLSSAPFSPAHHPQQAAQAQLPNRARIASSAASPSSAAGLTSASQGGTSATSGGGGPSRISRGSPAVSQSATPTSASNPRSASTSNPSGQSVSNIVITQIFVLLGTINQEKDKARRESQAEQISGMIAQYGMEVFPKFFRRAVQLNADYIFSNSSQTPQGSYELLSKYVQKIKLDPQEADNVADSIDTTEGDLFKNFDVSKFMDHFKLDPVAKSMLALSLKNSSKSDLRTKADAILANNFQNLLMTILTPSSEPDDDITPAYLFLLLDRFIRDPPRSLSEENRTNLKFAVRSRFEKLNLDVPEDISNLLQMADLLLSNNHLVKLVHKTGPRATSSPDECKDMLAQIEPRDCTFTQVANSLLYMVLGRDLGHDFDPAVFVATLKDHRSGKRLDWQDVVGSLDRDQLTINKQQFLALYNALLPLAQEYENFDIQRLWGGTWSHPNTQLSFIVSFLSCTPDELDASTIPRLRKAFTLDMYNDAPEDVKTYAAGAVRHPLVSLDAVTALFGMIFQSQDAYRVAKNMKIPETIINPHTDLFVVATAAVPGPWASLQSQAFTQLFTPFLRRRILGDRFVFHGLWKRDASWLIHRLIEAYNANPIDLEFIYDHAIAHDWLPTLTGISTEFGVDLAALAHGRGHLNLDAWLTKCHEVYPNIFPGALARILEAKAKNEMSMQRDPAALQTVSLSLKTVYGFLNFLDHTPMSEESHAALLKLCINAYPRLINYGEGVDEVIEANGKNGHKLSVGADDDMHNNFKKLYNGETSVRDIIEDLQRSKLSEDPKKQELFACMINGLFEEYSCFAEYPIDALSTTAVLFGGIINFNLLSSFALQVALANVLEAIQSSRSREEKMYKFGLQALKQFHTRLPDWPSFCERLLRIDELQGTEIWEVAEKVLRSSQNSREAHSSPKLGVVNGAAEDYAENDMPAFTCVYPDPPPRVGFYETPPEDVQDKVLFVLNNVSPVNVEEKQADLKDALDQKHHQWFAEYLVDQRAKLQANFQGLYLTLLEHLGDDTLWDEVLRETYVSIGRLLNSEAALNATSEKNHLKSLGSWLGSITLARDHPIRLKNLSFRDLLLQAHATERLAVAIPFTSKVLTEAAKSELFKPPNPWTLDVLKLLIELYHFTELRINLKFEIETLCTKLKVDIKTTEPSRVIRDSQLVIEEEYSTMDLPDHVEPFHDVAMLRNRASRGSFSPTSLAENIPDISARLVYPPPPNNVMSMDQLRTIFAQAAHQAITEIIFPVVERSVTIAAIAASQLAIKDFATEPDEAKLRNAAHNVVKSLSGSLAMVTCREPLRLSITNNIKSLIRGNHEAIGEGTILMFVNDNLDTICRVVEEAAEKYSVAEIENQLQQAVNLRQIHNSTQTDEPFNYPPVSKYAYVISDPYRLLPGGLRPEQLAIYEDFGPTGNLLNHLSNPMIDGRQGPPDVLPDQFSLTNDSAGLRSAQHPQRLMGAPSTLGAVGTPSIMGLGQTGINGYGNQGGLERAEALYQELLRALRESPEERISQLSKASPIREAYDQLLQILDMAGANPMLRDELASHLSHRMTETLFKESARKLEIEVLVQLLTQICNYSIIVASRVHLALVSLSDDEILNPPVTAHLISARLLDVRRVDSVLSKMLREKKTTDSIACLSEIVDQLLLNEHPLMVRGQIAGSFEALLSWVHDNPELEDGKAILNKLRVPDDTNEVSGNMKRELDDVAHIFEEWLQLHRPDVSDKSVASFMFQLHERGIFTCQEELALFISVCLDFTLSSFDREDPTQLGLSADQAYVNVDSLASLITALTLHQASQTDGEVKPEGVHFLESILSIVILYQCDHYRVRGEASNSKMFFRLYSSMLFDISHVTSPYVPQEDMYLVMARAFLTIQPNYLPGFVFSWLALISHRVFMPAMLRMASDQAFDRYLDLLQVMFETVGRLVAPSELSGNSDLIAQAQHFYRGVLRTLVVLQHDFPDFLVENHIRICNGIPSVCVQLKNLVLSATPSDSHELPSPFNTNFKLEMVEVDHDAPLVRGDISAALSDAKILSLVDDMLRTLQPSVEDVSKLIAAVNRAVLPAKSPLPEARRVAVINALVFYIVAQATSNGESSLDKQAAGAALLRNLARELEGEARHDLINGLMNQLRFPNKHTLFVLEFVIGMFAAPAADAADESVFEIVTCVLIERLAVQRPHPWGVMVALLEIHKQHSHVFWELAFIKGSVEAERLFASLNTHISAPRQMA